MKISEETSRGQYFIDLLDASRDHEVIPIPASIVKVTSDGKFFTVLVSIGPGVYGKAIQEDNIKVKRYDPSRDTRKPKTEKMEMMQNMQNMQLNQENNPLDPNKKEAKQPNLVLFLAIGGFALLVLLILIILFS